MNNRTRLDSWKAIGAYLQRDERTVRRWEKEEGLPVHRHTHTRRSSVYADPTEIDAWRASRKVVSEPPPPIPAWRRVMTPSFAAVMLACVVTVGSFRFMDAQVGQTKTLVCSGDDCTGTISPDGKSLLIFPTNNSVVIRDIATKKDHVVVEASTGFQITGRRVWSPDGSRIAYSRLPAGMITPVTRAQEEMMVVNRDGTKSHTVLRGAFIPVDWSPDGKRLLVGAPDQPGLLWVDVATGKAENLPSWSLPTADVSSPKVSPDGKSIAISARANKDAKGNVYVMASDGSGASIVSPTAAFQEPVYWTRDGRLVFEQVGLSASLWVVSVSNGKPQGPAIDAKVDLPQSVIIMGADQSGALYYRAPSSPRGDIFTVTMDPDTGKVTSPPVPLPVGRAGGNLGPRWSPDSRQLSYYEMLNTLGSTQALSVYSFDTGKTQPFPQVKLVAGRNGAYCGWSDGQSILFRDGANPREPAFSRLDVPTGRITTLYSGAAERAFVTNWQTCVKDLVTVVRGGSAYVRNLQTGSEKQVYASKSSDRPVLAASLSHDGRSIEILEQGPATKTLKIISSDGGAARELVSVPASNEPPQLAAAWSADDRYVYYSRGERNSPAEVFRVGATGGAPESVGLKVKDIHDFNVAPDGKHAAFFVGPVPVVPEMWELRNFLPSR